MCFLCAQNMVQAPKRVPFFPQGHRTTETCLGAARTRGTPSRPPCCAGEAPAWAPYGTPPTRRRSSPRRPGRVSAFFGETPPPPPKKKKEKEEKKKKKKKKYNTLGGPFGFALKPFNKKRHPQNRHSDPFLEPPLQQWHFVQAKPTVIFNM